MVVHCSKAGERETIFEEAVESLLSTLDTPELMRRTAALLRDHFGATRLAVYRWHSEQPLSAEVLLVDDPINPKPAPGSKLPLAGSAVGEAIRRKRSVVIEHIGAGSDEYREESELAEYGYGALACYPLCVGDQVLGSLSIAHQARHCMLAQCFQAAERIAKLIAIGLQNSLMVAEIQRLNELLNRENVLLKNQMRRACDGWRYVAESPAMREVVELAQRVAPSETTVLIRGETGTGKEGLARLVHDCSRRSGGPFIPVNLGAIPETLIESELFGHEKGAFSGAVRRKIGRFEQADGGTLFLDEVGDAPSAVQVKLLRALQEREIQRVGGEQIIPVDVRVVAATNRRLEQMVEEAAFRADLYYRLNIFPIRLPALRDRREDLRPLVIYLLERHSIRLNRRPPAVPEQLWPLLLSHSWPGNIRELENALERALILTPGDELVLPQLHPQKDSQDGRSNGGAKLTSVKPFDAQVKEILKHALDCAGGRVYGPKGAAAMLELKPTTLQGKLQKYGLR